MKKILLVALAVLMCSASFAQFKAKPICREALPSKGVNAMPSWTQIGTLFNLVDINGDTINVADTLAAGKGVVIDYSAVWCGWCWTMHQNHILEAIHSQLGDQVFVMWVEADDDTPVGQGITGGGNSQGDWTNGGTIPYPIVDDANAASFINTPITGFPTVVFISPSGYWTDVYGTDWGFGPYDANEAVAAIAHLMDIYPRPNHAPIVEIEGFTSVVPNNSFTYTANYVSVETVSDITWSVPGATPSTGSGESITVVFPSEGTYTVTVNVTNTIGTTTETLEVNVAEWDWGNTMSYDVTGEYVSSVGAGSNTTWGVKYPAAFMANRNYLDNVEVYAPNDGHYTLMVYQTAPGANPSPNDMLYQFNYAVSGGIYNTLPIYDKLQLDNNKDLWITFNSGDAYPAAGVAFCGDPNGSLVYFQSTWMPIYEASAQLQYTWMIKATTSATAPALRVGIAGPATADFRDAVTFTAAGPASATFSWSFDGGDPATATGSSATTAFATGGNHTVTLTATLGDETATSSTTINILSYRVLTLPYNCGFESSDDISDWQFIDADGDGYQWMKGSQVFSQPPVHGGSDAINSASFINRIGVLTPDNWFMTPKITVPAEGATIEWWEYGMDARDFADHYGVYVSTTNRKPESFTYTIFEGAPTVGQTWTKHSRSLAGFAGQDIVIAFRHFNITNMYWLIIDDLSITAGNHAGIEEANDSRIALYPNPTTSILNIAANGVKEVSVLDINGRTVMTEQNVNSIDLSELANGVYFVRVITNDGVATEKIVKK